MSLLIVGCENKSTWKERACTVNYEISQGTYWGTSKAGTVLEIKTMFKSEKCSGDTYYLDNGEWKKIL